MTCSHLKELYEVCQSNGLRMSSADLIHIVCPECGVKEVCPSVYSIEYDAVTRQGEDASDGGDKDAGGEEGDAEGEKGRVAGKNG